MIIASEDAGIANRLKALASCMRLEPKSHGIFWRPIINIYIDKNGRTPHRPESRFSDFFENDIEVTEPFPKRSKFYDSWRLAIMDDDDLPVGFSKFSDKKGNKSGRNIDLEYNRIPKSVQDVYIDIFKQIKLKRRYQRKIIKFYKRRFDKETISVHMRTWYDIAGSSRRKNFDINKFISRMKQFDSSVTFFVASDSLSHIRRLEEVFGDRIIVYSNSEDRTIEDDIIDLYLLAKGKTILGTYMSTFTEVAWWLSECNKNIEIL